MANTFVMSARQAAELDHAFERNGWTPEDVKWLSKGDTLSEILGIRNGTEKIVSVEVPKPAVSEPLLVPRGLTTVPLCIVPFVASVHFIRNTNKDASVKISYIGDNFKKWFLHKREEVFPESELRYADLARASVDGPIIEALGGEEKAETTLTEVFAFMAAQPNGKKGKLLTNSYANIFYVRDTAGALRAVNVYWYGDGWYVDAYAVTRPHTWLAGLRVFSRNSR